MPARPYTGLDQKRAALDAVREAPADDHDRPRDLRTQHGLGADPVDALAWLHEAVRLSMRRETSESEATGRPTHQRGAPARRGR
ncbi:hypothetical protein GCM10019016_037390 [Streptomyces prasinosporus]|uniref:Uncharacterized protein n=1 Tax=Streptomyces prasinosporus TaxID=68256 RepID=A0ABP6TMZ5_9ACTN